MSGALVAVVGRVRQLARPDGVEDDHARAGPRGYPSPVATALGLVGLVVFIAFVVALAAGVTWLVVRLSPNPESKQKALAEKP